MTFSTDLPPPVEPAALARWRHWRFGIFIHWGLYSIQGRGEWALFAERQDVGEYARLADRFTGSAFDAADLAGLARAAGAGYVVMTARHHDGFCLWDSAASGFTSARTAARRDFIGELMPALRAAGLGTGLYYSPLDWRFPGFFFPTMFRDSAAALRAQCHAQIEELSSRYGRLDVLWYDGGEDWWLAHGGIAWGDGGWSTRSRLRVPDGMDRDTHLETLRRTAECPGFWQGEAMNRALRARQPGILINDRCGSWSGDFDTREHEDGGYQDQRAWERCCSLAGSWGWQSGHPTRSADDVIRHLTRIACLDGNFLVNIAPGPDGGIDEPQRATLAGIGAWMRQHGDSVIGTRGGPFQPGPWGGATCRDARIFLHLAGRPGGLLALPDLRQAPVGARVRGGPEVPWRRSAGQLLLELPDGLAEAPGTIVELDFAARCW